MARPFSELKEKISPQRQEKIEEEAQAILLSMSIAELDRKRDFTQQQLAEILQFNPAALSKMGTHGDIRVSTLQKLVLAMGGRLKIVAEFPDGEFIISQLESVE